MRVPRCRTMMEPPGTSWPPNTLTPSRCAFESRPFLELPKPFLCAMTNCLYRDLPSGNDVANANLRIILPMPLGTLVLLLALELEDQDFVCPVVTGNGGIHASIARAVAGKKLAAILEDGQNFTERDFASGIASQFGDANDVARRHTELLSAGLNDCMHANVSNLEYARACTLRHAGLMPKFRL